MQLKDIMTPKPECVRPDDTLQEAAARMRDLDVGPLPVCGDDDRMAGMITDRDITVRATAEGKDPKTTRVRDVMTEEVIYCFEDQDIDEAARLMQEQQVRRLLVMNRDKRLVGSSRWATWRPSRRQAEVGRGPPGRLGAVPAPPLRPAGTRPVTPRRSVRRIARRRNHGPPFRDRRDAGRRLAEELADYAGRPDVLVLALPRGGVPVAYEVARALGAPLDVFLVRKLGVPGHEELAMGAIATGGVRVLNEEVVQGLRIPTEVIDRVAAAERRGARTARARLPRRPAAARGPGQDGHPGRRRPGHRLHHAGGRGRPAAAAARPDRRRRADLGPATCEEFRDEVDEVVCAVTPEPFYAVGLWYEDFSQTSDDEVRDLLARAAYERSPAGPGVEGTARRPGPGGEDKRRESWPVGPDDETT